MIALSFRFIAGRYHATPWTNQVNEGVVEWPPSPFRILRALAAASYKVHPRLDRARAERALAPLRELPVYAVPPAGTGHTRHYMPAPEPTKIFDAFVTPAGELVVAWPGADADPGTLSDLDQIIGHLAYLGRAESWVEAERLASWNGSPNVVPRAVTGEPSPNDTRLMALLADEDHAAWLSSQPKATGRQRLLPATWWDVLHTDTGRLFSAGWSRPPGTRDVVYSMNIERRVPSRPPAPSRVRPTVARYAIQSAVMPRVTETLAIAERARQALLKWSNGLAVFAGKDAASVPLAGNRHAYYLPVDDDGDGIIDHLVIAARDGFDPEARTAIEGVHRLWGHGGHDLALTLIGLGQPSDFGGESTELRSPALATAHTWESRTPFIIPRHVKHRGGRVVHGPEAQLRWCLRALGLPEPDSVEPMGQAPQRTPWWRFRRTRRSGEGLRGGVEGRGFRLQFNESVTGPIAVGYGAHFGLGQFVAV